MNPTELINYVKTAYGAAPEYLWPDDPQTFIFRHADNRKWFGAFKIPMLAADAST